MFTNRDLQELLEYKAPTAVLSVYLNTEPVEGGAESHRLRLRSMLKEVGLDDDVQVVERFFDHEFDWSGRSAAVFSYAQDGYFRSFSLQVPVRSRVRISDRPHVKPLVELLDSYGGYGVALVDNRAPGCFIFIWASCASRRGLWGRVCAALSAGEVQPRQAGVAE